MKEIVLRSPGNLLSHVVLAAVVITAGIWFLASDISVLLSLSTFVSGLAFILLARKMKSTSPLPIRFGEGIIEIPEKVFSEKIIRMNVDEISNIYIKSHSPRYIKTLEIESDAGNSSISLDYLNKNNLEMLMEYITKKSTNKSLKERGRDGSEAP